MNKLIFGFIASVAIFSQSVTASIISVYGSTTISGAVVEDFSTLPSDYTSGDTIWNGDDITLTDNGDFAGFVTSSIGGLSEGLYQNGGSYGHIGVSLTSGADIDAIEFELGHGWSDYDPLYVWVRTMNDGLFTGFDFDFDFDGQPGIMSIISNGTSFDELQIFASNNQYSRDSHSLTMYSAAAIDNIRIGSAEISTVPVPAAVWLFGTAIAGFAGFSRFKKKSA